MTTFTDELILSEITRIINIKCGLPAIFNILISYSVHCFSIIYILTVSSTLTDLKINLFLPLIPKGNSLIFSFHPLGLGQKKLKIFETVWSAKAQLV
jgi:hypothetical protein